jgi:exodeoxyribonuclease VII small subunit
MSTTATTKTPSYEDATARVAEIITRLDSGDSGLRETLDLIHEGRDLVAHCADELDEVSRGLEEMNLEALITRLETGRAATAA